MEPVKTVSDNDAIIKHFMCILDCDKIIITGSYALNKMGLCKSVKDIDIMLINPSAATIEILKKLAHADESKHLLPVDYPDSIDLFRIMFNGKKVDFFTSPMVPSREYLTLDNGITISTVPDIVRAKKACNRLKDILQLRNIAESIYKESDLNTYLLNECKKLL